MSRQEEDDATEAREKSYPAHHARFPHIALPHIRFTRRQLEDRPLAGAPHPDHRLHWTLYGCEAVATAVLMCLGIATNTLLLTPASPVAGVLRRYPELQIALCGLCFGGSGTIAAMTPFGRVSGAHLSPSVTLAFALGRRIAPLDALGYALAQIVGACLGTAAMSLLGSLLPVWRGWVSAVHYVATVPAAGMPGLFVLCAELVATMGLILALYWAAATPRLHLVAPWIGGWYFFLMNPLVAGISGDSTNFARSFGPDLFSGDFSGLWIYILGPMLGSGLAVLLLRSNLMGVVRPVEARIVNFGHHGRVPKLRAPEAVGPAPEEVRAARSDRRS